MKHWRPRPLAPSLRQPISTPCVPSEPLIALGGVGKAGCGASCGGTSPLSDAALDDPDDIKPWSLQAKSLDLLHPITRAAALFANVAKGLEDARLLHK